MKRKIRYIFSWSILLLVWNSFAAEKCSISAQDILFGTYDVATAVPTNTVADIIIDCNRLAAVTLILSASRVSGTVNDRRMKHSTKSDTLSYNLYRDAGMTQIWGEAGSGTSEISAAKGRTVVHIYGQIFPRQDVWIGAYADSLTLTVLP